ncbi:hypothetical protein DFH28DRAFT_916800 [Melampsora americana]|nr:hypothetical protein DFH28DRAFT_916800 [Melampsora americana]
MGLVEVGKAKLAAKEEERKQYIKMQEDRQALLESIRHERHVQLETIRSERKEQAEAAALERLRHQGLIHARKDKYSEQSKAMEVFRLKIASEITDRAEKMKGANILNNEDKAFFFNSLPEDMQLEWLQSEIKLV